MNMYFEQFEMLRIGVMRTDCTANLRTKIIDVRGFDSSIILSLRGEILMSIGVSPEILSQQIFFWSNLSKENWTYSPSRAGLPTSSPP